ncbi:GNAT family N-acetyltransferase [Bradyrhizobium sp. CCBAU 51753]|uniref:GNAT family N-acetyltransferase n=1 Tax=Bradyrhizobium sp. CCBAU 51753 TaxID=1325100 RepID=UPI00188D79EE|nr:GNAT family N-acetyltransferase [Bradyrhizobium sp. CCBAU 51753]QOZ29612.1 GNAT family N-acetyltransferase [Bradyrhizobium sp. CCBAU 51753]
MLTLVVTDVISPSIVKAIERGHNDCNCLITRTGTNHPLAVVLTDPETKLVVGGAIGLSSVGLLFVDAFFLPEQLRGKGLATKVLKEFEDEGRRRGCRLAFLYTIDFSDLYARNGWKPFGRTPCDRPETFRIFMTKSLDAGS